MAKSLTVRYGLGVFEKRSKQRIFFEIFRKYYQNHVTSIWYQSRNDEVFFISVLFDKVSILIAKLKRQFCEKIIIFVILVSFKKIFSLLDDVGIQFLIYF